MSKRLDQEREAELQPKRMKYATDKLVALGYNVVEQGNTLITFEHKGETVWFYPYSGWATGKTIKDGRGLNNLLKQLENQHDNA